jgi:hypothetical protein
MMAAMFFARGGLSSALAAVGKTPALAAADSLR